MKAQLLICSLAVLMGLPAVATAQARMPHKDASAIGGEVGIFLPKEDVLTKGPVLEGFYEYYLTARDSLRVGVGWLNPKWEPETSDSLRQIRLGVDLVHNWEGGAVHPFVGAGLGTYFIQFRDNGQNVGESETKLGGAVFGGLEYFTSNTFSVKGEARYHVVSKTRAFNPSGLSLTFGVKSYF
jgi:opacity protein-like surface antigen